MMIAAAERRKTEKADTPLMELRCRVKKIRYQAESGWTICLAKIKQKNEKDQEETTLVGPMPGIVAGSDIRAAGNWMIHPTYGMQFQVDHCQVELPTTADGIRDYLAHGGIKGIGPLYASRIVRAFGEDTITILDEEPERLMEVEGIGRKRTEKIIASWKEQREIRDIVMYLQSHNLPTGRSAKIARKFGSESLSIMEKHPYRLTEISGIGFQTADTLARANGIARDSAERCEAGVQYTLNQMVSVDGQVYAEPDQLIPKASETLGVDAELIRTAIHALVQRGGLIKEDTRLYLPEFYEEEWRVARRLLQIEKTPVGKLVSTRSISVNGEGGIVYNREQKEAIRTAMTSKIFILTGGPGTGKTTTETGIIRGFEWSGLKVVLAAPTGRAAKRMTETTHRDAKTIHRLIGYRPGSRPDPDKKIEGDVLILDECSMIDLHLMDMLLMKVPVSMRMILIGDTDQLPSVGAGMVLHDMIASGRFATACLKEVHRQAEKSLIIQSAHRINEGKMPVSEQEVGSGDCVFAQREDPEDILNTIVACVKTAVPRRTGLSYDQIQVLAPMRRGPIGTEMLNAKLQEALNPFGEGLAFGKDIYRVGDRVMQIRNNYDKCVFNGDIGKVVRINRSDREIIVDFDGAEVTYDAGDIDELTLSYACTIHKSQGSEFPVVVIPVSTANFVMLQKNLLYTGVTRAKSLLILVGTKKALAIAVHNDKPARRNSYLAERLQTAD